MTSALAPLARPTEFIPDPQAQTGIPEELLARRSLLPGELPPDIGPLAPVQLPSGSPMVDKFWLVAANVAVTPSVDPKSFTELSDRAQLKTIGTIAGISASSGAEPFNSVRLIVRPERPVDGRQEMEVVLNYPVTITTENAGRLFSDQKLPGEKVLWVLDYDQFADVFYCTNTYLCAFVQTSTGVRSATSPSTELNLLWKDFDATASLEELAGK